MARRKRIPRWVRRMRKGWLRAYLVCVFLPARPRRLTHRR